MDERLQAVIVLHCRQRYYQYQSLWQPGFEIEDLVGEVLVYLYGNEQTIPRIAEMFEFNNMALLHTTVSNALSRVAWRSFSDVPKLQYFLKQRIKKFCKEFSDIYIMITHRATDIYIMPIFQTIPSPYPDVTAHWRVWEQNTVPSIIRWNTERGEAELHYAMYRTENFDPKAYVEPRADEESGRWLSHIRNGIWSFLNPPFIIPPDRPSPDFDSVDEN